MSKAIDATGRTGAADALVPRSLLRLAAQGALATLPATTRARWLGRTVTTTDVSGPTRAILERVRAEGDAALFALAQELDGVTLENLEVPRAQLTRALDALPAPLREVMERSRERIARVHSAFRPRLERATPARGIVITRRPDPLDRVGVYAPGGRASYPSSVLMGVVPAKTAGVREVIVCSPPSPRGAPADIVLAAAALAGATRVFAVGGAGAIAAMARGTHTIPRVDRIVGPGNAWVMEAKRQLAGEVGIDTPAGPSELLAIADDSADPVAIAREMVAQAEHDPDAIVIALALDRTADAIIRALHAVAPQTPRHAIVAAALAANGAVLAVADREEGAAFAGAFAPEHLLLATRDPGALAASIRHAGAVFLGTTSSVVFGDYTTGANHVLPTGGLARTWSGLSTLDFVRWTTLQSVSAEAAKMLAPDTARFAEAEALTAHAETARAWSTSEHPQLDPDPIDLAQNTDRFGVAEAVLECVRAAGVEDLACYPSPSAEPVVDALADRFGVSRDELVIGCGSDDILDLAFRTLAVPETRVAYATPTFSMIPEFVAYAGLVGVPVPCTREGRADIDALLAARTPLVYLCSPNNPTGGATPEADLDRLLASTHAFVVLDEAYAEFADDRAFVRLRRHPRLLVTRTFSKAYGLAGLRIGYGCGPAERIAAITRRRGPYRVTRLAERAAVAALAGPDLIRRGVVAARAAREELALGLTALGFAPLPSDANFVLLPVRDGDAAHAAFARARIVTRVFRALPAIGDALRVTVGPPDEIARVLAAATMLAREVAR